MQASRIIHSAACAILFATCHGCAAASLSGGPMAGFSAADAVAVWLMTDTHARVGLEYWLAEQPLRRALSPLQSAVPEQGFSVTITLKGLAPDTAYQYRVLIDGKPIDPDAVFAFRTQPATPRTPRDFLIAAGSCSHIDETTGGTGSSFSSGYGIFDHIAALRPQVMLWLGDHIYYRDEDFGADHIDRMHRRWAASRSAPALQKLLNTGHHYAIWDDHDYGPNNANRHFPLKDAALDVFRRNFPNPPSGLPDAPGVFFKTTIEDVDVFMLDDRFYRDDDDAEIPEKTMLGRRQLEWLMQELLSSKATFKLVANGSRMLSDQPSSSQRGGEGWHNFGTEREAFLDWLARKRIDGVCFLSGDIHYTHLTRRERPGTYPLTELTCSPLTSRVHPRPHPVHEVPGTLVAEHNFCTLAFSGPAHRRTMKLSVWNTEGMPLWEKEIPSDALRSP